MKKWSAENGFGQAVQWCKEGRDANAWIDLEIVTERVLTAEEQKLLRTLHHGIINIRPKLKQDALNVPGFQNREGKKTDELFREYFKYRTGVEISEELMGVFIEVLNDDGAEATEATDGGAVGQ